MERGLDSFILTMTDLEVRAIVNAVKKQDRKEKEVALCYRGTAYKKSILSVPTSN